MVKTQHNTRQFAERILSRRFRQFIQFPTCFQYCIHKSEINEEYFKFFISDSFDWLEELSVGVDKVGSYLVITVRR